MKYYEINETAARQARESWSFSDYSHGSKTAEYRASVDECYNIVEKLPDDLKEKGEAMADRYARHLAEWYNKQFRIEMMCPSIMIAGGSNFPVRKKEKQDASQDRHYQLYQKIQAIPEKIKHLLYGTQIIKSSDSDAIEQLQKKAEKAEALQAEMKSVNAYYRKHKTLKGYKDYTDEKAAELDEAIKSSMYGVPFPPYALTNNNAKIKNTKARIAQLERLKAAAETATEQPKDEYNTDMFEVIENAELMRLQLKFDGKPDADVRAALKSRGFKWSPKNGVWQRQLTTNAKYAVKALIEELGA
jgi:DNA repair exonuclease SbcCD ATPase subunit